MEINKLGKEIEHRLMMVHGVRGVNVTIDAKVYVHKRHKASKERKVEEDLKREFPEVNFHFIEKVDAQP